MGCARHIHFRGSHLLHSYNRGDGPRAGDSQNEAGGGGIPDDTDDSLRAHRYRRGRHGSHCEYEHEGHRARRRDDRYGWSAEELQCQHPYLSLGQIHSALAYYWYHAEDPDRDIERRMERSENLRTGARPSPLLEKLRARGARLMAVALYADVHIPRAITSSAGIYLRFL